ncbi:4-hydroxyphenylacetate 3-monooxygenase [Vibrio sp. S9_S30]|uniref:4-hydroxyphenylacetate 3-hydroxylase family protein n=1 Tax=Vibrio sp. S9_S30 TaxID=2720226 RepID=UPI00167FEC11|nr:4-hydroxyphenylacetate 3-hydroxylase N-terminal domain-containing protein [Vibrio sp. S9_S30]MBD1559761.1 4-hydroxyphenylacetate 3-monooxygenase [Vibrio sp. S9_S30]
MLSDNYIGRITSDSREIYVNGELIDDVSKEPTFIGAIEMIKSYYNAQEEHQDVHTFIDEHGNRCAMSLMFPKTLDDLKRKRECYKSISELSYGMLGRTPDFINSAIVALASNAHILGQDTRANYAKNAADYYEYCKSNNLFIGHAAINPQIDRSKNIGAIDNQYAGVRVVSENENGIVVSGAKMIVTLGPIVDELLVFNMPGLKEGDEEYAVAFSLPVGLKGVKQICRKPLNHPGYSQFDHPIASLFDEIDVYLVLDNVEIPWDRVLVYKNVEKSNAFYDKSFARNHTGHQGIVRGLTKAELVTGTAIKLAENMGLAQFPNVQEKLGEMTTSLELVKGAILLTEHSATKDSNGVLTPNITTIQALRYHFPKWYQSMTQAIQSFAAGSMLAVPHKDDFQGDNASILIEALDSPQISAKERSVLLNLAWDLSGDAFGQRQLSYEFYHAGDPMRIAGMHYKAYDINTPDKLTNEIISGALA